MTSRSGSGASTASVHKNLKAYLTLITNKLDIASSGYTKYDYIVLSFDGNRLTSGYNAGNADWTDLEDRAARCLKPFYKKNLVMWLVDAGSESDPFYGDDAYFTPNAYRKSDDGGTLADPQWNGYVALMDPVLYLDKPYGERFVGKTTTGDYMYMNRIDAQAVYGDTTAVSEVINKYIKLPSYEAQIADNVATVESKLKIPANSSVTLYTWTSGTAPDPESKTPMADQSGWSLASSDKLDIDLANNGVKATNLVADAWTKIEIKILADDDFLVSAVKDPDVCTYNEETQTYEVNPNKGEAKMTLYKNLNGETTFYAAGAQAAMNAWGFEKRESSGGVISVTRVYDGTATNIVAVDIKPDCGLIEYSTDEGNSWSETNPTFTHAGTYPVWYRVTYENAEAKKSTDGLLALPFTNDTGYVCITQRVITVTADDKTQTYGDADAFTYQITTGTLVGSDKLTGKLGRTDDSKDVGEYDIVATTPFAVSPDYIVTFNKGTLTINQAELTVVPNAGQHVCEGDEVDVKFTATGFKYSDSQTKNYVGGSYSLESQALGKQAIVDNGGWDFGKNYIVVSSDTQGRTFEIKECSCVDLTCVYVYRVKLAGKTVKGRSLAGKTSCDETTCWAKPASLRIAGYIYGSSGDAEGTACDPCSCNEWTADGAMCHFWDENKHQVFADVTTFGFDLFEVLRNSGSMNKVQVFWNLGGLKLAGFGAFNPNTQTLKNANGFFAGALAAPTCSNWNAATCSEDDPTPAHVFAPCKLEEKQASAGAVSYGRWSLTYKADKARQAEEDDTWDCLYPTGWQPVK